jgi:hypothetical protein
VHVQGLSSDGMCIVNRGMKGCRLADVRVERTNIHDGMRWYTGGPVTYLEGRGTGIGA